MTRFFARIFSYIFLQFLIVGAGMIFFEGIACAQFATTTTSTTITVTVENLTAPPPSSGGGGGGGVALPLVTQALFRGKAYPLSSVTLLKDAQVVATTKAGPDSNFEISLAGLSAGNYMFGVWAEDMKGNRSLTQTFAIAVTSGANTVVSGIFLPPTIGLDKTEVKRGDPIMIFGASASLAEISVIVNSDEEIVQKVVADGNGVWSSLIDSLALTYGDHATRARAQKDGVLSTFSQVMHFKVGTKNVFASGAMRCPVKGDLNGDCRVNLVDFSIAAYWYKRTLSPVIIAKERAQLSGDGRINLIDFSIMAFYWTG